MVSKTDSFFFAKTIDDISKDDWNDCAGIDHPFTRYEFFQAMRAENIGVNVHYVPLYQHPLYSEFGFTAKDFPNSTYVYERILTLPIWPGMTDDDVNSVIIALNKVVEFYVR